MAEIYYNVTVKPDDSIHDDWLQWMREIHIPEVLETGCFLEATIHRIRIPAEDQGQSYTIQYRCPDMATLQKYQALHAPALQKDHSDRYRDKFVAFRTVTEVVSREQKP